MKYLIITAELLLTGCVSYYYPETALEDGVYYAQDDPSYVVYYGSHPGAAYYPWTSFDYFYMGFNPYPRYAYFHGFPFGFLHGYSPWHYPYSYYGYYSPLYSSYYHYPYFPVWRPYSGYCSHYGGCGRWSDLGEPGSGQNRHAGNTLDGRRNGDNTAADSDDETALAIDSVSYNMPVYGRYVSTTPSGYYGNRGMVIRSSETTKIGKSRIQPVESGTSFNSIVISTRPSQTVVTSDAGGGSGSSATRGAASGRSSSSSTSRPSSGSTSGASSRSSNRSRSSSRSSSHRAPRNSKSPVPEKRD